MEIIISFIAGLLGFILGALIFYIGYRLGVKKAPKAEVEKVELTQEEQDRHNADMDAYTRWLNYSAAQAYMLDNVPKKK